MLVFLVLHMRLRCGSLSITTPVPLLVNEFYVRNVLLWQVSLVTVNQIYVFHEAINGCKGLISKCKYSGMTVHVIQDIIIRGVYK